MNVPLLSLTARLTPDLCYEKKFIRCNKRLVAFLLISCVLCRCYPVSHVTYLHSQFSVVEEILHRVLAGELVQYLGAIGDHTCRGVYRGHTARDVDVLDVREVRKMSTSNLID